LFQAGTSMDEVEIPGIERFSGTSTKMRSMLVYTFFLMLLGRVRPAPTCDIIPSRKKCGRKLKLRRQ